MRVATLTAKEENRYFCDHSPSCCLSCSNHDCNSLVSWKRAYHFTCSADTFITPACAHNIFLASTLIFPACLGVVTGRRASRRSFLTSIRSFLLFPRWSYMFVRTFHSSTGGRSVYNTSPPPSVTCMSILHSSATVFCSVSYF